MQTSSSTANTESGICFEGARLEAVNPRMSESASVRRVGVECGSRVRNRTSVPLLKVRKEGEEGKREQQVLEGARCDCVRRAFTVEDVKPQPAAGSDAGTSGNGKSKFRRWSP